MLNSNYTFMTTDATKDENGFREKQRMKTLSAVSF